MEGLLYRYLVRRTSGAEDREVYAWLEASEKNRSLFFEVAAVWSAHRTLISPATGERCDAMLRRLNARIDADDAMQRPARFAWRRWMSAAAAAAVVVIAVAAAWLAGLRLPGSRAVPVLCQPYRRRGRPASGGRDAGVAARRHRVALCRRQGGRGADRAARRRGLFRRVARCAASLRRGDPRAGDPGAGHGLQCPGARRQPVHGGGARTRRRTPRNPRRRQPRAAASQPARRVRRPDGRHGGGRNQRAALW